jgi:hypothetical protein
MPWRYENKRRSNLFHVRDVSILDSIIMQGEMQDTLGDCLRIQYQYG